MADLTPNNLSDLRRALKLAEGESALDPHTLRRIAHLIRGVVDEHVALAQDTDWVVSRNPRVMNEGEMLALPTRTLGYALDKLKAALRRLHSAYRWLKYVPEDIPGPAGAPKSFSVKQDALVSPLEVAFDDALKGYLALAGKLTLGNDASLAAGLLGVETQEFANWLNWVGQDWGDQDWGDR